MSQLPYIVVDDPSVKPMDAALDATFEKLGIPRMGGASGFGWSRYKVLQECPQKFYLSFKKKLGRDGKAAVALELGACFHAFLALYYQRMIDFREGKANPVPEAGVLCDELLAFGADAVAIQEAWRLFEAYANYYESIGDYLVPLAVERHAKDPCGPSTCRYDMIARVEEKAGNGILPGTYIVEHKTSARMDESTTSSWHLDGEIIGQLMLYKKARLDRVYGKLQGVIVNIVTKTKMPNFHREIVAPPMATMRRQSADLAVWRSVEALYESTNTWPRALAACWGRYGKCQHFEYCRDGKGVA